MSPGSGRVLHQQRCGAAACGELIDRDLKIVIVAAEHRQIQQHRIIQPFALQTQLVRIDMLRCERLVGGDAARIGAVEPAGLETTGIGGIEHRSRTDLVLDPGGRHPGSIGSIPVQRTRDALSEEPGRRLQSRRQRDEAAVRLRAGAIKEILAVAFINPAAAQPTADFEALRRVPRDRSKHGVAVLGLRESDVAAQRQICRQRGRRWHKGGCEEVIILQAEEGVVGLEIRPGQILDRLAGGRGDAKFLAELVVLLRRLGSQQGQRRSVIAKLQVEMVVVEA